MYVWGWDGWFWIHTNRRSRTRIYIYTHTNHPPTHQKPGARSPLSSVMLILGVVFLVSCGAIVATLTARGGQQSTLPAPAELQLQGEGPEEGAALAREGASWKLPSLHWGTPVPTPVPTPAPTAAPTGTWIGLDGHTKRWPLLYTRFNPPSLPPAAPTLAPTAAPTIPALTENLALGVCWAPRAEMKDPEEIEQDALLIRRHFHQVHDVCCVHMCGWWCWWYWRYWWEDWGAGGGGGGGGEVGSV